MRTKLAGVSAVITLTMGLFMGAATVARADSPVIFRFHAVHNSFSGDNEICGIPAYWTYTENATIKAMTAKDITLPDLFAYGKVTGPVWETFTTAQGSITLTRDLAVKDVRRSYSEAGGVISWLASMSGSLRLVDNSTGRLVESGAGRVVFREVWDTTNGTSDETVDSSSGTLRQFLDGSCSAITAVLT